MKALHNGHDLSIARAFTLAEISSFQLDGVNFYRKSYLMNPTPGERLRTALAAERPLQIAGVINAYIAIMAKHAGFKAIYLSGAGVANLSYGFPDIGVTTLDNVLEDVNRITASVDLPLLVDIDTGWGNSFMIARTIKAMIRAAAAAVHIEDQVFAKRCGHLSGKTLVSLQEMIDRIKAAVDARTDASFMIMARTDALSVEGLQGAIERAQAYREAGADMIFPDAVTHLDHYRAFKNHIQVPLLANITEFGKTPLFDLEELRNAGVDMALYPLSASRAMNSAAWKVLQEIRKKGTQKDIINLMQTREELYHFLDYKID